MPQADLDLDEAATYLRKSGGLAIKGARILLGRLGRLPFHSFMRSSSRPKQPLGAREGGAQDADGGLDVPPIAGDQQPKGRALMLGQSSIKRRRSLPG